MLGMAAFNFNPIIGGQGVPINLIQTQHTQAKSSFQLVTGPQNWLECIQT